MSLASAIPAKALGSKTPERPKPIAPDAPRLRFSCATGEGFGSPVSSPVELHQRRNSVWMLNTKRQSHWRPAGFIGRDSPGRYCLWCGRLGCMCLCAAFWLARRRDACTTKFVKFCRAGCACRRWIRRIGRHSLPYVTPSRNPGYGSILAIKPLAFLGSPNQSPVAGGVWTRLAGCRQSHPGTPSRRSYG